MKREFFWYVVAFVLLITTISGILIYSFSHNENRGVIVKHNDAAATGRSIDSLGNRKKRQINLADKPSSELTDEMLTNNQLLIKYKFNPENALVAFRRIDEIVTNIGKRSALKAIITMSLCNNGYEAEAWEMLEPNDGAIRQLQMVTAVEHDKRTVTEIQKCLGKNAAMNNVTKMMVYLTLTKHRTEALQDLDFAAIDALALKGITNAISWGETPTSAAKTWNEVLNMKTDGGNNMSGKQKNELLKAAAVNLVKDNINEGMRTILHDPQTKTDVGIIDASIREMYDSDPTTANTWVNENIGKVNKFSAQIVKISVAKVAMGDGDFETARKWIEQLDNEADRIGMQKLLEKMSQNAKPNK